MGRLTVLKTSATGGLNKKPKEHFASKSAKKPPPNHGLARDIFPTVRERQSDR